MFGWLTRKPKLVCPNIEKTKTKRETLEKILTRYKTNKVSLAKTVDLIYLWKLIR